VRSTAMLQRAQRAERLSGGVGPWPWAVLAWAVLLAGDCRVVQAGGPVSGATRRPLWNLRFSPLRPEADRAGGAIRLPGVPGRDVLVGGASKRGAPAQRRGRPEIALAATAQAATRNAGGLVPISWWRHIPACCCSGTCSPQTFLFAVFSIWQCWDCSLHLRRQKLRGAARSLPPSCARRSRRALDRRESWSQFAAVLLGACLVRPYTSARFAVIAVSVAAALALLAAGSRFGASSSDQASAVFVPRHCSASPQHRACKRCGATRDRVGGRRPRRRHDGAACRRLRAEPVAGPCSVLRRRVPVRHRTGSRHRR